MEFEDYNYAVYNPYILIEDKEGDREVEIEHESRLAEKEISYLKLPDYKFTDLTERSQTKQ
jgi:hypothetical protein